MSGEVYINEARQILTRIEETQMENIKAAAKLISSSIEKGRMAHLFGAGHAGLPVQEVYPRTGSFLGFHPMLELSLSWFTNVVGSMGVRQFCFLERVEGYGEVILQNYDLDPRDTMVVFSQSGINNVVIDIALGAQKRGLAVVGITSLAHSRASKSRHSSGKKLYEIADVVLDNCVPLGDSLVEIEGLEEKVGPGSTLAFVTIINSIVTQVACNLVDRGIKPLVSSTLNIEGDAEAEERMEQILKEYKRTILKRV